MCCKYSVNRCASRIEISCEGQITRRAVCDMTEALGSDQRSANLDELRDYTRVTEVKLTALEMDNVGHLLRGHYMRSERQKRIAIIAPDGPGRDYAASLCRVLDTLRTVRTSICASRDDALDFLSVADMEDAPAEGWRRMR